MSSTTMGGRVAAPNPVLLLAAVGLLLAAIVGLALMAGRPAPSIPAGPASNGRIVALDGTSLVTFAPDGTDREVLLTLPSPDIRSLAMSPDGTRVAYPVASANNVQVVRLADGALSSIGVEGADAIGEEYIGWSPDGRDLTFAVRTATGDDLVIASADGSSVRSLGDSLGNRFASIWQPAYSPDGQWIAFAGSRSGATRLVVVRPDGSGLRELDLGTRSVDAGDGGGPIWSPDRAVHRLAYEWFTGTALQMHVFDIDTNEDYPVGDGFWPAWSPDGSRLAGCCASVWSMDDVLAGLHAPETVFAQSDGYCPDNLDWTGRAACSTVTWSPDGEWLVAGDVAGKDLLIARSDGTGQPILIPTTTGVGAAAFRIPLAWQPIWP